MTHWAGNIGGRHALQPQDGNPMADVQVRLVRSVRLLPYHCQEVTVKLERETPEVPLLVECTAALQCAVHALVSQLRGLFLPNTSGFTKTVDSGCVIGEVAVESPPTSGKLQTIGSLETLQSTRWRVYLFPITTSAQILYGASLGTLMHNQNTSKTADTA